jgi:hypothetical protein
MTAFAPAQRPATIGAGLAAVGLFVGLLTLDPKKALLFLVGLALGITLYHAAFGFTGAYRRAIVERDTSGVAAQAIMIAMAMLLFAPILSAGSVFGHGVSGAVAPVSVSMAFGAFLFGVGMQIGGGCASGTLFTAGGGNVRMAVVLVFFCIGAFWGSLDLAWWTTLPSLGRVSLAEEWGWAPAILAQLATLAAIYAALRFIGGTNKRPLWPSDGFSVRSLLHGPWPLLFAAGLLALLNWLTLLIAGHAWSITWAFSLWAAKVATLLGWDPATSAFWSGNFQQGALSRTILSDTTSVMNIGIIIGAFSAAALAGKLAPNFRMGMRPLLAAIVGGLMLGYGARLAYGCNIGAFFSGIASTSLHGWVWILAAIPGNIVGVRLRPIFGLSN